MTVNLSLFSTSLSTWSIPQSNRPFSLLVTLSSDTKPLVYPFPFSILFPLFPHRRVFDLTHKLPFPVLVTQFITTPQYILLLTLNWRPKVYISSVTSTFLQNHPLQLLSDCLSQTLSFHSFNVLLYPLLKKIKKTFSLLSLPYFRSYLMLPYVLVLFKQEFGREHGALRFYFHFNIHIYIIYTKYVSIHIYNIYRKYVWIYTSSRPSKQYYTHINGETQKVIKSGKITK